MRLLIQHRSDIDRFYAMEAHCGEDMEHQTSGGLVFNEDIVCTYIDLDALIDSCGLSELELLAITERMKGYSLRDVAEEHGYARSAVYGAFGSGVDAIVKEARRRE